MVINFDIDGVLCNQVEGNYEDARPNQRMIDVVNRFYDQGCRIILNTSRFMGRTNGDAAAAHKLGYDFTRQQLEGWGVRYHELFMGKPRYDVVIDDRSVFYDPDCAKIEEFLAKRLKATC